jgi:hypothetical protein
MVLPDTGGGIEMLARSTLPPPVSGSEDRAFLEDAGVVPEDSGCWVVHDRELSTLVVRESSSIGLAVSTNPYRADGPLRGLFVGFVFLLPQATECNGRPRAMTLCGEQGTDFKSNTQRRTRGLSRPAHVLYRRHRRAHMGWDHDLSGCAVRASSLQAGSQRYQIAYGGARFRNHQPDASRAVHQTGDLHGRMCCDMLPAKRPRL